MFPRDMVCLRNIRVDTLHKEDTKDNNNIIVITLSYTSEAANHSQELMINMLVIRKPLTKPVFNPIFFSQLSYPHPTSA